MPPRKKGPHRHFYPNAKKGQEPHEITAVATVDNVITAQGVAIDFHQPFRRYSPDELKNLARWLFSLSHVAEEAAHSEYISEEKSYDFVDGKVVPPPADL